MGCGGGGAEDSRIRKTEKVAAEWALMKQESALKAFVNKEQRVGENLKVGKCLH